MNEVQHGYRRNRGTTDLVFGLKIVMERIWEFDKDLFILFIDLKKVFDSVPRRELWRCLEEEYGVRRRLIRAIKGLYDPCLCILRTGHPNRSWFRVTTGVK